VSVDVNIPGPLSLVHNNYLISRTTGCTKQTDNIVKMNESPSMNELAIQAAAIINIKAVSIHTCTIDTYN
jgi:hypothetical protein